jgi:hypothetical protein
MRGKKRTGWIVLPLLIVLGFSFVLAVQYFGLPADAPFTPKSTTDEIVEIPRRPGIYGILIDIPQEKPNIFSVDVLRSESIDWDALLAVDYRADVRVYATIGDDGRLKINDVIDVDHARAGRMIAEAVRSWVFKPLKSGPIVYHFNLPSEGEKLIIYTAGLRRLEAIDREIPILDGRLHNVVGLNASLVRIIK